jgi:hypothetical protein
MRDINDSRGMSANGQNLMQDIHAYRDSKMKVGAFDVTKPDD